MGYLSSTPGEQDPLTFVSTDDTLTGDGTFLNPLHVVGDNSFETVSKNLLSYNNVPTYLGSGLIDYITYTVGGGTIVKTYNYSGDLVSSIVLSGDTPSGISLTKTFIYSGTTLTGITYS